MTLQNWKIISKPSQHADSRGPADGSLTLPQTRGKAKKQSPSNQAQWKPNSKAGQLMGSRADSGTWGQHTNLNGYTPVREEPTKQLPLKDRRKKKKTTKPHGGTMTELLLKYQHQDWMLVFKVIFEFWSNTRTQTKTKILFFLNLEFFVSLFVIIFCFLFVSVCLFICPH
jgi:hypothetical protein